MLTSNDQNKSNNALRLKLLIGQILLATIVSSIFIVVAYRLACDISETYEVERSLHLLDESTQGLKEITAFTQSTINTAISQHYPESRQSDHIILQLCQHSECLIWQTEDLKSDNNALLDRVKAGENSGFFFIGSEGYIWVKKTVTANIEATLLIKSESFYLSLKKTVSRLSIAAFITFWVAVWTALTITAISVNRIEKSHSKLRHIASHDPLTDLPNRALLMDTLRELITTKAPTHILLIDLNKFKDINDTMGHNVGDEVLIIIAKRLKLAAGKRLVFRYGGDEFIVLFKDENIQEAEIFSKTLINECNKPVILNGQLFSVGASIGIASYPSDADTPTGLLKSADIAMYRAKALRTGISVYQSNEENISDLRMRLRGQIPNALQQKEFLLLYQPKVSVTTQEIVGVEALVRWNHPSEGLLTPNLFINMIEETGIVHDFCYYTIACALKQIKEWKEGGLTLAVAVNLSPYNVIDESLPAYIAQQLDKYALPPDLLELELTESGSMIDIETISNCFERFREVGVKLSIDDFGTGMSSLAYIKQIGVDTIKIDRSFVQNITKDKRDQAILHNIIALCHDLDYEVVAEGVERYEQLEKLAELNCGFAQGYYFSQPVTADIIKQTYFNSPASNKRA